MISFVYLCFMSWRIFWSATVLNRMEKSYFSVRNVRFGYFLLIITA